MSGAGKAIYSIVITACAGKKEGKREPECRDWQFRIHMKFSDQFRKEILKRNWEEPSLSCPSDSDQCAYIFMDGRGDVRSPIDISIKIRRIYVEKIAEENNLIDKILDVIYNDLMEYYERLGEEDFMKGTVLLLVSGEEHGKLLSSIASGVISRIFLSGESILYRKDSSKGLVEFEEAQGARRFCRIDTAYQMYNVFPVIIEGMEEEGISVLLASFSMLSVALFVLGKLSDLLSEEVRGRELYPPDIRDCLRKASRYFDFLFNLREDPPLKRNSAYVFGELYRLRAEEEESTIRKKYDYVQEAINLAKTDAQEEISLESMEDMRSILMASERTGNALRIVDLLIAAMVAFEIGQFIGVTFLHSILIFLVLFLSLNLLTDYLSARAGFMRKDVLGELERKLGEMDSGEKSCLRLEPCFVDISGMIWKVEFSIIESRKWRILMRAFPGDRPRVCLTFRKGYLGDGKLKLSSAVVEIPIKSYKGRVDAILSSLSNYLREMGCEVGREGIVVEEAVLKGKIEGLLSALST